MKRYSRRVETSSASVCNAAGVQIGAGLVGLESVDACKRNLWNNNLLSVLHWIQARSTTK